MSIRQLNPKNKFSAKRPRLTEEELFIVDNRLPLRDVVIDCRDLERQNAERLKALACAVLRNANNVAKIALEAAKVAFILSTVLISAVAYSISREPHLSRSVSSMPVGISAIGTTSLNNHNTYVITNKISGSIDIKEMNVSSDAIGLNLKGFGLGLYKDIVGSGEGSFQLNSFLLGTSTKQLYWVQNVAEFNTRTNTLLFVLNVWDGSSPQPLVIDATLPMNYKLPMKLNLSLSLKTFKDAEYLIFNYQINNGIIDTYYTYELPSSTFMLVASGFTPSDLVVCGPYNFEIAYFNKINASLALYYESNGKTIPFSDINTIDTSSIRTGESAANVNASVGSNSHIDLSVGNPTNTYLTNFNPITKS